jgi:hypothetical protein
VEEGIGERSETSPRNVGAFLIEDRERPSYSLIKAPKRRLHFPAHPPLRSSPAPHRPPHQTIESRTRPSRALSVSSHREPHQTIASRTRPSRAIAVSSRREPRQTIESRTRPSRALSVSPQRKPHQTIESRTRPSPALSVSPDAPDDWTMLSTANGLGAAERLVNRTPPQTLRRRTRLTTSLAHPKRLIRSCGRPCPHPTWFPALPSGRAGILPARPAHCPGCVASNTIKSKRSRATWLDGWPLRGQMGGPVPGPIKQQRRNSQGDRSSPAPAPTDAAWNSCQTRPRRV